MSVREPQRGADEPASRRLEVAGLPLTLEQILLRAATDQRFKAALLEDRRVAASEYGHRLTPTEDAALQAIPQTQLMAAIEAQGQALRLSRRRSFVRAVAACATAMAAGRPLGACEAARADDPGVVRKVLLQEQLRPISLGQDSESSVAVAPMEWVVVRLAVKVRVRAARPGELRVQLESPSGTRVLLTDGRHNQATTPAGLAGTFGGDGLATVESLTACAGEPVAGRWTLRVSGGAGGALEYWALDAELAPNTSMASPNSFGMYGSRPGCDCG